ncbi:sortase domain-containing protein [Microlunatus soli]|uniref:Sortase family protein n=1 Tax=Microlunatus soli TaxID=630515 RepID=A0A1H1M789_9ACTN|nr:sortase [Microlunatus soli]SDR81879.1 Sortase family protein [Microlunatus soli]
MNSRSRRRSTFGVGRQRFIVLLVLAVVAVLFLGRALAGFGQDQAGSPGAEPSPTAPTSASPSPSETPTPSAAAPLSLTASKPKSIKIPSMKVDTDLDPLGKKQSKYVVLPKKPAEPGWYEQSATPGELGISTVIGYIRKSAKVPGVFVHLKKLDKGDHITISRADGTDAVFAVDRVKSYTEKDFDSDEVYGQSKPRAELRLITCGGTLKPKDPPGNVVVFAHLIEPDGSSQ